jgi:hypothetical protein
MSGIGSPFTSHVVARQSEKNFHFLDFEAFFSEFHSFSEDFLAFSEDVDAFCIDAGTFRCQKNAK